jgi:osmotically-inducible protein OsmY
MRKFFFGAVIASITAAMPTLALGGDREIAQSVMSQLQQHKAAGSLKGFDIDMKVEQGVVYLTGTVANQAQQRLVENAALNAEGAVDLISSLKVKGQPTTARNSLPVESLVVPASTTSESAQPSRNDLAITDTVISALQQAKRAGILRGFELDVSTVGGDVWLRGIVASQDQKDHILDQARHVRGVKRVIDDITVASEGVRQASAGVPMPLAGGVPEPLPAHGASMPMMHGGQAMGPRPFAPTGLVSNVGHPGAAAHPVAMQGAPTYGAGAPRYDQPNLPSYAWPSYAAYPNYAAVTYPKQYSPSAWPYIGPFYPYPQVPLGWRKVALEWDDGLWYLDFTSK